MLRHIDKIYNFKMFYMKFISFFSFKCNSVELLKLLFWWNYKRNLFWKIFYQIHRNGEGEITTLYKKNSVEKLEKMLKDEPNRYKQCRLERQEHFLGTAVILKPGNAENGRKVNITTKKNHGRTFDGDIVVVEVL